ncbi:anthranilate synthase component II [Marinagarivorans algicola]|uniref:anthranilate synthase component II n=1 Tax=Marinagarivorans algicola TaxID=1513270 RepID=UPI0006B42406|nr:aminodeoxychorismate/anthranilate synthase component II [Marinagarivorans algicola]
MKVLIIDNFDSFTYNLYQYVGEILSAEQRTQNKVSFELQVIRNNALTVDEISALKPDRIIISPGPGSPDEPAYFGVCAEVIVTLGKTIPVLGVCLGMQGIVHCFGGKIVKNALPVHGKTSVITHNQSGLFNHIPNHIEIMRYHSLMAEPTSLPNELTITALVGQFGNIDEALAVGGPIEIMAIAHKQYPIYGIQYHPESFASEGGKELIKNFLYPE